MADEQGHYNDPLYYTHTYRHRTDDVRFYLALADTYGGPVLEYGIGNGRIALPLARHGHRVTGVDRSRPMLHDLRLQLAVEPPEVSKRIQLHRGDMRQTQLHTCFPLVLCPFNAALHLSTRRDVERFLARVREHLAPGGLFVVDLTVPALEDLASDPDQAHHAPRFRHPSTGEIVRYWECFDYDPIRQTLVTSMTFEPVKRAEQRSTVQLPQRQFFPQEWEALLHYNGFAVEAVEGDFQGGPLDRQSDVMVWYARVRRGWKKR